MKETTIASTKLTTVNSSDATNLSLLLADLQIDELQRDDALGIPELGASLSYYGCCSYSSSL